MTTPTPPQKQNGDNRGYAPGTYVYDTRKEAVGRIADPNAYPPGRPEEPETELLVPIQGDAPGWRAQPATLRLATQEDLNATSSDRS
ncbi:hypothetical protein [Streptomyces qinglanensis]|uniref:hypothetical protein n=1 Tax=Streptomyces qinglanensis TaxID=943816 RepID=UPI003D727C30